MWLSLLQHIQLPLGGTPSPKLWLQGCVGERSAQAEPQVLLPGHQGRTPPLEATTAESGRQKEKKALGEQAASGSSCHYAANGEALGGKPPARALSVGCTRKKYTYINARATSVSGLPLGMKERKHVRSDK